MTLTPQSGSSGRLPPLEPGFLIGQRYQVVRSIDRGNHGSVYEVQDTALKIRMTCKEMDWLEDPAGMGRSRAQLVESFQREAVALNQLHHPNISPASYVTESYGNDLRHYLMTRYLEGKTLAESYSHGRPRSWSEVRPWFLQVASAIAEFHRYEMVHGDIRPANILLETGTNRPYVTDLGHVKIVRPARGKVTRDLVPRSQPLEAVGYWAPEVMRNQAGPASDIYSLGMLLYWALTDLEPAHDFLQMGQKAPVEFNSQVPAGVSAAIVRATRAAVGERFSTVAELVKALDDVSLVPTQVLEKPAVVTSAPVQPSGQIFNVWTILAFVVSLAGGSLWALRTPVPAVAPKRASVAPPSPVESVAVSPSTGGLPHVRAAAERGSPDAQVELADRYRDGRDGVAQDINQAATWYRKAAEQGNVYAEVQIAVLCFEGRGTAQSDTEAAKWYRKAADQGDPTALCNLGFQLVFGRGVAKDEKLGVEYYRKAAEKGNLQAVSNLGDCYRDGIGVVKDTAEAVKHYRRGVEKGSGSCQSNLAWAYENGVGVEKDLKQAAELHRKAAEQGQVFSQKTLGRFYRNGLGMPVDHTQAAYWFGLAAKQGDSDSLVDLGFLQEHGMGVAKDPALAFQTYRKAAELNNAWGIHNVGACYLNGVGVGKDVIEAARWYRKAADAGLAASQVQVGCEYSEGTVVARDREEAVRWFRKAAEQGNAEGQAYLASCYLNASGVMKDEKEAAIWYRKSAEQGNAVAQVNVGALYEYGKGVPLDTVEATRWYRKAAEQGYAEGQRFLANCYRVGVGVEKNRAEAVNWYQKAAAQGDAEARKQLGLLGRH